jgi:hypothetical protein
VAMSNKDNFIEKLVDIKKARLIENKMSYEELEMLENFSDDEVTLNYIKDRQ